MKAILYILFLVFLLPSLMPIALAGPFIGASIGMAVSSTDAPALTRLSVDSESSDDQAFSRLAAIGYRAETGLWVAISYGLVGEFSSSATASDFSNRFSMETSKRSVEGSFLSLTAGKFLSISSGVGIDVNAGIVSWRRDTENRSIYVLKDFPTGPIVDAADVSSSFSDHGINGTVGIFLAVQGEKVGARIGVQYYGGLNMTVPMAGIDYSF